ncbi:response regulator [Ramlibacter tataouinensis]|uniref:Candidate response regulator, CheY n=1 Tax=Ramlibacter tataouinensis (strain ATCC BAA-407 / DSM 14655 / LMG 21543 / TTB310) TaxID=365046 RepID=F5XWR8_RAMTT|nr:response regulator [Ramlibacter tataouinensis]AEG94212.1 candidate response regulator, CheY [Ramlibacter tataouinensis TTB310]
MTGAPAILLVEDNPDDVLLIRRAFRRSGITTPLSVVGDGDAAVAYLAGEGPYADRSLHPLPRLVLLDLKLPCRSGLEVLAWIRGRPAFSGLVVVVLTSSSESRDLERAYALGVNSFLVKPVEFDRLLDMVKTLDLYWLGLNEYPPRQEAP